MADLHRIGPDDAESDSWWVISASDLRSALARARDGEDVDLIEVELYANSETTQFGDDD